MNEPSASTLVQGAVGLTSATFPWWGHFVSILTGIDQAILGIGGLVVLALTIWKLIGEIRVNRQKLKGDK